LSDFLEPPKKRRRGRFVLRVDPDRLAAILQGEADRLHRVRSAGAAKSAATRKRNTKERHKAFLAEWKRTRRGPWPSKLLELLGWQVLVARMAPGAWYARPDLRDLIPEYAEGSVRAWVHQKLLAGGLVERAGNPEFDHGKPGRRQATPQWLYRLTEAGIALGEAWREALGE
jgi:hypothetical protein